MKKFVSKSPEVRGGPWNRFFLTACRGNQPFAYLDIGLWPPDLWETKFLLFKPHSLCGNPRKLIHHPNAGSLAG